MVIVKLKAKDNLVIEIDSQVAQLSETIKTLMMNYQQNADKGDDSENTANPVTIALPEINSTLLGKVLEWCEFHYLNKDASADEIDAWEKNYLSVENAFLFDIIRSAHRLNVPDLVEKACNNIQKTVIGMNSAQMREFFLIDKECSFIANESFDDSNNDSEPENESATGNEPNLNMNN